MTFEEYIYDIMEIKGAIEDDSDLEPMWVLHKLNQYRAVHIVAEYASNHEIDPVWLQRIYKFKFAKTNASDDPSITYNSITLGKAVLPRTVKLSEDIGTYRISGSGAILQFEPCDFNRLMMKIEIGEESHGQYGYYAKLGDTVYIHPYIMEGSAIIIAENPMDVQINDNGILRDMTFADEYPLDPLLAQRALLDFLTKDMAIAEGTITDIINDSQDKLKILKDNEGERSLSRGKR